jgi:FMNH2-dependent dimethyl sulfone monooxygenase
LAGRTDLSADRSKLPILNDENALKLAIFGINLRGGVTMSDVPGKVEATWEESLRLARRADGLGLDGIVPVARWRGYAGDANLGDRSFETLIWATGLLAATERIQVFSTMHVPLFHPVLAAKMAATVDHVSKGRFGLNIVAGWNAAELEMFGVTQREHDARYDVADEWTQILKQSWAADGEFEFSGKYFDVPGGFSEPKPLQRPHPVIMSAGTSPAGRHFAARHSDVIFAGLTGIDSASQQIAEIKHLSREKHDREIRVFGRGHLVIGDTEKEAWTRYEYVHRQVADVKGAANVLGIARGNTQSVEWTADQMTNIEGMTAGFWAIPMVGTAEQVTEQLLNLHRSGADGIALSWVDFDEGLSQLEADLLPRLIDAGVRSNRGIQEVT